VTNVKVRVCLRKVDDVQTHRESSYYAQAEESVTDEVVYLLGAGYSASLGLPVMSNFLMRSKDISFSDPERFSNFKEVFDTIKELSYSKNYYDADLFNIEEILSILEMRGLVGSGRLKSDFVQYILDVIEYSTPSVRDLEDDLPHNWHRFLFTGDDLQSQYGYFVSNLLGLQFKMLPDYADKPVRPMYSKRSHPSTSYSVITLNYDMVLESYAQYIERNHPQRYANEEEKLQFRLRSDPAEVNSRKVSLAKLHGSVDTGVVVPPTWNKALN